MVGMVEEEVAALGAIFAGYWDEKKAREMDT